MKTISKQLTILIVDDDEIQVSLLQQILQQEPSYKIITTTSGEDALRLAEMYAPSIIVSDYYMPGINGFELCKKIKEHPLLRTGIFILLTSATAVQDKVQGLDSGADEFLSKPIHPDEFFSRVHASARIVQLQKDLKLEREKLAEANTLLQESYNGMLDLLAMLVGVHVPHATKHAERAAQIVRWCGKKLSIVADELQTIQSAAVLHEIGKISLPEDVAQKDDKSFDTKERAHYPMSGRTMLSKIPRLKDVAILVGHQLENYDGTGFPDRLMGAEIPLGARILRGINFLEHLDAQSKKREELIDALFKARGSILDPIIVQVFEEFLRVVDDKEWMVGKRSITVIDIKQGMKLAGDLNTGNGTKLLPKDTVLTQTHIERIKSHHQLDPIVGSIFIYE